MGHHYDSHDRKTILSINLYRRAFLLWLMFVLDDVMPCQTLVGYHKSIAGKLKCLDPLAQKVHGTRCWFASHDWHRVRFHSNHYRTMTQFDVGIGLRTPSNYINIQLDSMNPTMSEPRLIQFFSLIWATKKAHSPQHFSQIVFGRNLHPWSFNSLPPQKWCLDWKTILSFLRGWVIFRRMYIP